VDKGGTQDVGKGMTITAGKERMMCWREQGVIGSVIAVNDHDVKKRDERTQDRGSEETRKKKVAKIPTK